MYVQFQITTRPNLTLIRALNMSIDVFELQWYNSSSAGLGDFSLELLTLDIISALLQNFPQLFKMSHFPCGIKCHRSLSDIANQAEMMVVKRLH